MNNWFIVRFQEKHQSKGNRFLPIYIVTRKKYLNGPLLNFERKTKSEHFCTLRSQWVKYNRKIKFHDAGRHIYQQILQISGDQSCSVTAKSQLET